MAIGNLYVHSCVGQVHAYWTGGAATGTLEYSLDAAGLSGWTVASAAITGSDNNYAHTLSNSTTARWWRYTEGASTIYFADDVYANSGTFKNADGDYIVPRAAAKSCFFVSSAGSDGNSGATPALPKLTHASAIGSMAAGDHVLTKRGDTITLTSAIAGLPNGASATAMTMLGAYGPATGAARVTKPVLSIATAGAGFFAVDVEHGGGSAINHIAIQSHHVSVGTRVDNNQNPFWFYASTNGDNILMSDLSSNGQAGGITIQLHESSTSLYTNVVIHRCVFRDGHSVDALATRDQALLVDRCDGLLLEDIILIDNGWAVTPGTLDQYSHNMYLTEHCSNVTVRNVLSIGADNQTRPGGLYEQIAVIQAPLGFTAGGLGWNGTSYVSQDATYRDFLIDGSRNRDVALGWGFWTADGTNGLSGSTATIKLQNGVINLTSLDGGTTVGTQQIPYLRQGTGGGHAETQIMDGVVIPRSSTASADYGLVHLENSPGTFRMVRCVLDAVNSRPVFSEASATHPSWQLGGNSYYTARSDVASYSGWFINQNGASGRTVAGWASYVGDPTSGLSASTKLGSAPTFTEQRRTTDYIVHVMGAGKTLADFKDACEAQQRGHWLAAYTAANLVDWVIQGYGCAGFLTSLPAVPTSPSATVDNSTQITFTFVPSPIATSHEVRISVHDANTWTETDGLAAGATSKVFSGLDVGGSYDMQARGRNTAGASDWTPLVTATTTAPGGGGVGSPPTIDSVMGLGPTSLRVTFTPTDGGTAAGYQLEHRLNGDTEWIPHTIADPAARSHDITTGLSEGRQWNLRIKVI